MACFLAPAGAAVVTTIVQRVVRKKETTGTEAEVQAATANITVKWSQRLRWLNTMLWGGAALLCLEHIWHGEVVPWPPFLTAMTTPGQIGPMLREIATYGTAMTVAVIVAWAALVGVAEMVERRGKTVGLSEAQEPSIGGDA